MTATLTLSLDTPADVDAYVRISKRLSRDGLDVHGVRFEVERAEMTTGEPPIATVQLREAD